MVEFQDYVHKPTQQLRQSLIYSGRKKVRGVDGRQLVLVPNFRTFTEAFSSNRASLLIVTSLDEKIRIRKVVLRNLDTGIDREIDLKFSRGNLAPIEGTKYSVRSLVLIDKNDRFIPEFNTAEKLELIITYDVGNDESRKESMLIKRITKKDFAWPT
ncbi:MAG: hypothetical protein AB8B87_19065 [Granulosicoccus sp.]